LSYIAIIKNFEECNSVDFLSIRPISRGNLITRRFSLDRKRRKKHIKLLINITNLLDALFRPVVICTR